jgi:sulfatase maturation enzyme AslB (radical SAM superfamily)
MIEYAGIRDVHLEISTFCNAACPQCPRNFNGYPHNDGYPELNLTLDNARCIFSKEFLQQLTKININGNFGDLVMNPESADIVEYFANENKNLKITISTNGGARNRDFWQRLARTGAHVYFCLDGLEDTHHLYRQNTVWSTVIKNAQTFIEAGGHATWKMIEFKHNQHQITDCRVLANQLGFRQFQLVDQGRDTGPVYDKNGNLTHVLGDYQGETEFRVVFHDWRSEPQDIKNYKLGKTVTKITCDTITHRSIYVAANGDIFPCCYLGLYPRTFGHGTYSEAANAQIAPLMRENNALEFPLDHCLKWFKSVEESWKKREHSEGRLFICDNVCGS